MAPKNPLGDLAGRVLFLYNDAMKELLIALIKLLELSYEDYLIWRTDDDRHEYVD